MDENKMSLKQRVCEAIDRRAMDIIAIGQSIFDKAELGFKEHHTSELVASKFKELGLTPRTGIGITGIKAYAQGSGNGPTLGIMGELDAVICHDHPNAVPDTGAVHACGHNAQIAAMLGAASGLLESGVMPSLAGRVVFIAVPSEEFVELEYRQRLRKENKVEFFGGKQEFIRLGEFEDVDLCMMIHSEGNCPGRIIKIPPSSNGFTAKTIRFIGREAHAGGAPYLGVNALNAAMLGLMGIHAQRETFKDNDMIRIHPIITKGGDLVNIVPADVRMETYVRGRNLEAILDASKKVNRALHGGAMAIGAEVEIDEIPGYLPLRGDKQFTQLFASNAAQLIGDNNVLMGEPMGGSTDMGDLSYLLPSIHPMVGGIQGALHTRDFAIVDPEMAYVIPAKIMAMTAVDLLYDGAAAAQQIIKEFQPAFDRDGYLEMWRQFINPKHQ